MHYHRCLACGHIWRHGPDCRNDENAHRCPACGHLDPDGHWPKYNPTPAEEAAFEAARLLGENPGG